MLKVDSVIDAVTATTISVVAVPDAISTIYATAVISITTVISITAPLLQLLLLLFSVLLSTQLQSLMLIIHSIHQVIKTTLIEI